MFVQKQLPLLKGKCAQTVKYGEWQHRYTHHNEPGERRFFPLAPAGGKQASGGECLAVVTDSRTTGYGYLPDTSNQARWPAVPSLLFYDSDTLYQRRKWRRNLWLESQKEVAMGFCWLYNASTSDKSGCPGFTFISFIRQSRKADYIFHHGNFKVTTIRGSPF